MNNIKTFNQEIEDINNKTYPSIVEYVLLFLTFLNAFGKGSVFCLLFIMYEFFRYRQKGIRITYNFFINYAFTMLMLLYIFICENYNIKLMMGDAIKSFNFIGMFVVGTYIYNINNKDNNIINKIMYVITIASLIHLLAILFYNLFAKNLDFNGGHRYLYDIWTNELLAGTNIGVIGIIPSGFLIYLLFIKKGINNKIFGFLGLSIIIIVNMYSSTRTPIFMLLLLMILSVFLYLFSKDNLENKLKYSIVIILLLITVTILYQVDFLSIKTNIINSSLYNRFLDGGLHSPRYASYELFFQNMISYPFGGKNISKLDGGRTLHNFWFEVYDQFGFIIGVLGVSIFIFAIYSFIYLLFKNNKNELDYVFILVYFTLIIESCLEPLLYGYPIMIWLMFFINGIMTNKIYNERRECK